MLERDYQRRLIQRLNEEFPDCLVLKNDPNYIQGMPDLTVFVRDRWAMLEVKRSATAPVRPNQAYYVDLANAMSYATYIYPENEDSIFDELRVLFFGRTR